MAPTGTHPATFQWSLKPLILVGNLVGLPLNVAGTEGNRRRIADVIRLVLVASFCCFILVANLGLNGRNLLDFKYLKRKLGNISGFDSPYEYFKANPQGLITLVRDLTNKWFFAAVPCIHFTFMAKLLLTRNWTDLWTIILRIQNKMKLDGTFHRKCRKHCIGAILYLVVVG